jgi:hypothetical protein
MDEHVCIGMAQGTFVVGDLHATQTEGASLLQAVYVVSKPYSHARMLYLLENLKVVQIMEIRYDPDRQILGYPVA